MSIVKKEIEEQNEGTPVMLKPHMSSMIQRVGSQVSMSTKSMLVVFSAKACKEMNIEDSTYGVYFFLDANDGPQIWALPSQQENPDAYKFVKAPGHQKRFCNSYLVQTCRQNLGLPEKTMSFKLEVMPKDKNGLYPLRLMTEDE